MAKTITTMTEGGECFFAANGQCIASLKDLAQALESMEDGTFHHHVNDARNDFSSWAKGALKDDVLSEQLLGAKDRKSAQIVSLKRMISLMKELV